MNFRSFFILLIIGILAITSVYGFVSTHLLRKEYEAYREEIFVRAYESSLSELSDYLEKGDPSLAEAVMSRLWDLPLSDREIERVRKLGEDMARGAVDSAARKRALSYAEELFRHLSGNRTAAYRTSRHGGGMGFPPYPDEEVAVGARPEESDLQTARKALATSLLNSKNVIAYERKEGDRRIYGYRTASSFAEMTEEGKLLRFLGRREEGVSPQSESEAKESVLRFFEKFDLGTATLRMEGGEGNIVTFHFESEEDKGSVSVSGGVVCRFRLD